MSIPNKDEDLFQNFTQTSPASWIWKSPIKLQIVVTLGERSRGGVYMIGAWEGSEEKSYLSCRREDVVDEIIGILRRLNV